MPGFTTAVGVAKHSLLKDLTADDHPQYMNSLRDLQNHLFTSGLESTSTFFTYLGTWGFDGNYFHAETPSTPDYSIIVRAIGKLSQGATFEFKGKMDSDEAYANQWVGLTQPFTGVGSDQVYFGAVGGSEYVRTASGGVGTSVNVSPRDWTVEHTFKAEWGTTSVKFYEDGVLLATMTTNIPSVDLYPTMRVNTEGAYAPVTPPKVYMRNFKLS